MEFILKECLKLGFWVEYSMTKWPGNLIYYTLKPMWRLFQFHIKQNMSWIRKQWGVGDVHLFYHVRYCGGNTHREWHRTIVYITEESSKSHTKVDKREHAKKLFKSGVIKFHDLFELWILLVMYKAIFRELLENLRKLFIFSSENQDNRGIFNFKNRFAQTTSSRFVFQLLMLNYGTP